MFDVIVVGAGPAGNITALDLSNMGYEVAVLDWRQNIGDKLCTGIVGAECVRRFPPNTDHIYQQARAATVVSPAGTRYRVATEDPQAFIIDRVAYVRSLAQRASNAGARYLLGQRVERIAISDEGVAVSAESRDGQRRHQARMLVLACGFGSPLVKMVGLRGLGNGDYMVGSQAQVVTEELDNTEVYLGKQIAPGSFGWLVPISNSRALAGIVSRSTMNGHMDRFLSNLRSRGRIGETVEEPKKWGIPLRPLARTYGDRVLVIGDTAGLAKPTTGGGIYYSLISGEMAAEAVSEAFTLGDFSARQLRHYERGWKRVFGRELRTGYYARLLYESLGDRQIELLLGKTLGGDIQAELVNSGDFSFDWHSRAIFGALGHREVLALMGSFGPIVCRLLSHLLGVRATRQSKSDQEDIDGTTF